MATITLAETVRKDVRASITRYRFRYTLDNGQVLERNAWVKNSIDEATERTFRGNLALTEEAEAEAARLLGA